MCETYCQAEKIIVLDSSILQRCFKNDDALCLFLSIRTSMWGRRLWTFHEAALAKEIFYQFSDQAVNGPELIMSGINSQIEAENEMRERGRVFERQGQESDERLILADPLVFPAWSWLDEQNNLAENPSTNLDTILKCLCWRWTSRPEDEAVCLSGILGFDLDTRIKLANSDALGRMKMVFQSLKSIPAEVLFVDRPRMQEDGIRWMPTSLIGGGRSATMVTSTLARVSPQGLRLSAPGVVLKGRITPFFDNEALCVKGDHYSLTVMAPPHIKFSPGSINRSEKMIILKEKLKFPNHVTGLMGALVSAERKEGEEQVVRFEQIVKVYSGNEVEGVESTEASFTLLGDGQKWCIR